MQPYASKINNNSKMSELYTINAISTFSEY